MPKYFEAYDDMGEPRTMLSEQCAKRPLELSLVADTYETPEERRLREQAEYILKREEEEGR